MRPPVRHPISSISSFRSLVHLLILCYLLLCPPLRLRYRSSVLVCLSSRRVSFRFLSPSFCSQFRLTCPSLRSRCVCMYCRSRCLVVGARCTVLLKGVITVEGIRIESSSEHSSPPALSRECGTASAIRPPFDMRGRYSLRYGRADLLSAIIAR